MNAQILVSLCARRGVDGAETPEGILQRVASAVADVEERYGTPPAAVEGRREQFVELMKTNRFWPAGRILNNAGTLQNQLASCFVLPLEDDFRAVFETLATAANCHRMGGGTGFDLSALREEGDTIRTSEASGACNPALWLGLFDVETKIVMAAGKRRGANSATLSVYHPDILSFVSAKSSGSLDTVTLAVRIDDAFMNALTTGSEVTLRRPRTGAVARSVSALVIWDALIQAAWSTGEPGVVFEDRVNSDNVLRRARGRILCANPCGEQLMYPFESSLLGSLNLRSFVDSTGCSIAWDTLEETVSLAVRFLDNALDVCDYPDGRIASASRETRRIGLGVMGFADLLIALGIGYGSAESLALVEELGSFIAKSALRASERLAGERGVFPSFTVSTLQVPRRHCAVTAIAPTGAISMIAECSPGIEPRYAPVYSKDVLEQTGIRYRDQELFAYIQGRYGLSTEEVEAGILRHWPAFRSRFDVPAYFRYAHEVTPSEHIDVMAAWQKHVDNGVSKTVNLPRGASRESVRQVFELAWQRGCKGVTVYREGTANSDLLTIHVPAADRVEMPHSASREMKRSVLPE